MQTTNATAKLAQIRAFMLVTDSLVGAIATYIDWAEGSTETIALRLSGDRVQCLYNRDFVLGASRGELFYTLQHVGYHVAYGHLLRPDGRDVRTWDVAADMCVNGHRENPLIGYLANNVANFIRNERPDSSVSCLPLKATWAPPTWLAGSNTDANFNKCKPRPSIDAYYTSLKRYSYGIVSVTTKPHEVYHPLDDHSMWPMSDPHGALCDLFWNVRQSADPRDGECVVPEGFQPMRQTPLVDDLIANGTSALGDSWSARRMLRAAALYIAPELGGPSSWDEFPCGLFESLLHERIDLCVAFLKDLIRANVNCGGVASVNQLRAASACVTNPRLARMIAKFQAKIGNDCGIFDFLNRHRKLHDAIAAAVWPIAKTAG